MIDISTKERVVILLSGGMDSTTLLYDAISQKFEVYPLSFDYGQRHRKEIMAAEATCSKLDLPYEVVDVEILGKLAPSALTRHNIEIPHEHYEDESMKQTVVPNRNMVLLSLATAYAIGIGANTVAYGAHGGDHAIYPDCRSSFIEAMAEAMSLCDYRDIKLWTPYLHWYKTDILRRGIKLGVDYSLTWTCYEGKELACGKCGSCRERLEAFKAVGVEDPIKYSV